MRRFSRIITVTSHLPIVKEETQNFLIDYLHKNLKSEGIGDIVKTKNKITFTKKLLSFQLLINRGSVEVNWLNDYQIELVYQYKIDWSKEIFAFLFVILIIMPCCFSNIEELLTYFSILTGVAIALLLLKFGLFHVHSSIIKSKFPQIIEV